jgi:hypothetical protein
MKNQGKTRRELFVEMPKPLVRECVHRQSRKIAFMFELKQWA